MYLFEASANASLGQSMHLLEKPFIVHLYANSAFQLCVPLFDCGQFVHIMQVQYMCSCIINFTTCIIIIIIFMRNICSSMRYLLSIAFLSNAYIFKCKI